MKIEKLKEKLKELVFGISEKAIKTESVPRFWQLYLDSSDEKGFNSIDTCATSQCLSILAKANHDDATLIGDAVESVIRLRNEQGSWPSAITPEELLSPSYRLKGDTAIGDNCFALTALLDIGFLDEDYIDYTKSDDHFKLLSNRIKYVFKAVDWLLSNRADDNKGWYYTDKRNKESVILTTINVTSVFIRIIVSIDKLIKSNNIFEDEITICRQYRDKIFDTVQQEMNCLLSSKNIFDDPINDRKAIGCMFDSGQDSIIHTCKLLNILIDTQQHHLYTYNDTDDFIRYVVKSITDESYVSNCEKYCFEHYTLQKKNALGASAPPINVDHENYYEAIILSTIARLKMVGYESITNDVMITILNALIERMNNIYPPFFKCRSQREAKNGYEYPVYASYEAFCAITNYFLSQDEDTVIIEKLRTQLQSIPFKKDEPYIFISYSHKNTINVWKDVIYLKQQGFNCWIDAENLDAWRNANENDWEAKVKPIMEKADYIITYASKEGFESLGYYRECNWLNERRNQKLNFYCFLIGFNKSITTEIMLSTINSLTTISNAFIQETAQNFEKRKTAYRYITNCTSNRHIYYHYSEDHSHLQHSDFLNGISGLKKIV